MELDYKYRCTNINGMPKGYYILIDGYSYMHDYAASELNLNVEEYEQLLITSGAKSYFNVGHNKKSYYFENIEQIESFLVVLKLILGN